MVRPIPREGVPIADRFDWTRDNVKLSGKSVKLSSTEEEEEEEKKETKKDGKI